MILDLRSFLFLKLINIQAKLFVCKSNSEPLPLPYEDWLRKLRKNTNRPCFPKFLSEFPIAKVVNINLNGACGKRPARIFIPKSPIIGSIFFIHGGGFVHCGLDSHHGICCRLAQASGCVVVSFDYRLAPQHPFPSAVEDCWAGLKQWADYAKPKWRKLVVAGDSAGGNLAAVMTHLAKEKAYPKIDLQLLYYPSTHGGRSVPSHKQYAYGYMLTEDVLRWYASQYLTKEEDYNDPRLAPILYSSFDSLPPAIIITADCDPLRDEGYEYAQKLKSAGVPVIYRCYRGTIHAFLNFYSFMPKAKDSMRFAGKIIRKYFQ